MRKTIETSPTGRPWVSAVFSALTFFCLLVPCVIQAQQTRGNEVLLQADFEEAISHWQWWGKADFGFDGQEPHAGARCARITAAPGMDADCSQWQYIVPGVSSGERLQAEVWLRTKDVPDGRNACIALEYLDSNAEPCGVDRSRTDTEAGKKGWVKLTLSGRVPDAACMVRVGLILKGSGTAWFDDLELLRVEKAAPRPARGPDRRTITIRGDEIVQPRFGGVGYQTFITQQYTQSHFDQVVGKRWRELNPSFARVFHHRKLGPKKFDEAVSRLAFLKTTGTEVYMITDNPQNTDTAEQRNAYAKQLVDELESLVRGRELTNIKYYCMTNELSLQGWGRLGQDLPKFKDYHRALFEELRARNLDIHLLATDASPITWWNTIHWATRNMDQITGVYGGHHYIYEFALEDERFYPWFLCKMKWAVGMAKDKNKGFILGEFGAKQDGRTIDGVIMDRCVYWGTPQEPLVSIQVAEAALAAVNAGAYAMCYWTFMDIPSRPGAGYRNQWGLFRCDGDDHSTRPIYYAYGLLSKYFRGPAAVHRVDGDDPLLRTAAVQHHDRKTWSVAVVNRHRQAIPVSIRFQHNPPAADFRKYVYNPSNVTMHPFGDLPGPVEKIKLSDGLLNDTLAAGTLTVYTTAYDDKPPAVVNGLAIDKTEDGKRRLRWNPSPEADLCYYRLYRSTSPDDDGRQIASTIATEYVDDRAEAGVVYVYRVVAVDQSGNSL